VYAKKLVFFAKYTMFGMVAMKEVSLNTTRQAQGSQKAAQAQAQPTDGVGMVAPADSLEANMTRRPDFTRVEVDAEARFDQIKERLRDDVQADRYPPSQAIEQFSKLLATEIEIDNPRADKR